MSATRLTDDFYERIKPRLHRRVGRELRLAGRVLDLGCGSCDLVKYLAETYCQEITGVDISSKPFPARRQTPRGVQFHCLRRNACHLKFVADGSVDAVVMFWSLHEMGKPGPILAETRRVLRPGGKILIVEFPKESLAGRLWDEKYYRPDQILRFLVRSGFEEAKVRLIERRQVIWAHAYQPQRRGKCTN